MTIAPPTRFNTCYLSETRHSQFCLVILFHFHDMEIFM
jgi:hypothetical protein